MECLISDHQLILAFDPLQVVISRCRNNSITSLPLPVMLKISSNSIENLLLRGT